MKSEAGLPTIWSWVPDFISPDAAKPVLSALAVDERAEIHDNDSLSPDSTGFGMNKNRPLLLISALTILALSLAVLPGCEAAHLEEPVPTNLVVSSRLYSQPGEQQFLLDVVFPEFEEENNCRVMFEIIDDDPMLRRAKFQKESGRVTTDVVIAHSSRMDTWIDSDYLVPLPAETWTDRHFSRAFSDRITRNDVTWFAPVGGDVYLTLINKKALRYLPESADAEDLTWEEYVAWSLAIAEGEGEGKVAITGVDQRSLIYMYGNIILSYGGGFPEVDSPAAREAWTLMSRMQKAYSPHIETYDNVSLPMKTGESWLTVAHMVRCGEAYSSNPDQFILSLPPRGPAGRGSIAATSGYGVVAGSPNNDLAVGFVEYMTRPEVALEVARGTGGFVPPIEEALALLGDSLQDRIIARGLRVLSDALVSGVPGIRYESWNAVKQIYDDAFEEIVIRKGRLDTEYLEDAQKRLEMLRL